MFKEIVKMAEDFITSVGRSAPIAETVVLGRASMVVEHRRNGILVDEPETVWNQITNTGRDFLHQQGYQGPGAGQGSYTAGNGLNWIALTNTAITPAPTDTTLSGEITTNGLARTQGTVTHTTSTNTTTIANTFTCATSPQAAQAAALFTAGSGGVMNHELTFTQRSLQVGDTLTITYTITLG